MQLFPKPSRGEISYATTLPMQRTHALMVDCRLLLMALPYLATNLRGVDTASLVFQIDSCSSIENPYTYEVPSSKSSQLAAGVLRPAIIVPPSGASNKFLIIRHHSVSALFRTMFFQPVPLIMARAETSGIAKAQPQIDCCSCVI